MPARKSAARSKSFKSKPALKGKAKGAAKKLGGDASPSSKFAMSNVKSAFEKITPVWATKNVPWKKYVSLKVTEKHVVPPLTAKELMRTIPTKDVKAARKILNELGY